MTEQDLLQVIYCYLRVLTLKFIEILSMKEKEIVRGAFLHLNYIYPTLQVARATTFVKPNETEMYRFAMNLPLPDLNDLYPISHGCETPPAYDATATTEEGFYGGVGASLSTPTRETGHTTWDECGLDWMLDLRCAPSSLVDPDLDSKENVRTFAVVGEYGVGKTCFTRLLSGEDIDCGPEGILRCK